MRCREAGLRTTRFLKISVPRQPPLMRQTLAASSAAWPFSPQMRSCRSYFFDFSAAARQQ